MANDIGIPTSFAIFCPLNQALLGDVTARYNATANTLSLVDGLNEKVRTNSLMIRILFD